MSENSKTLEEVKAGLRLQHQQIVSLQADAMSSQMILSGLISAVSDLLPPEKLKEVFDRASEIATVMAMRPENKTSAANIALQKIEMMRTASLR